MNGVDAMDITLVENDGRHGTLCAAFPFSHRIIQVLNAPETREALEEAASTQDKKFEMLYNVFTQCVGGEAVAQEMCPHTRRYLHDFVHISCPNFTQFGLNTMQQVRGGHATTVSRSKILSFVFQC